MLPDVNSFKPVEMEDKAVFKQYFSEYPSKYCDMNFVNLVAWNDCTGAKWQEVGNRLFIYYSAIDSLVFQIGKDLTPSEMNQVSQKMQRGGKSGVITLVKPEYVEANRTQLEKYFTIEENELYNDYIYSSKKLASLSGKKLSKKKNLVNQFKRQYPNYVSRPLTSADREICLELTRTWTDSKEDIDEYMEFEMEAIQKTWDHFDELGMEGVIILVDNQPVAYTIYSWQSHDTVDVHFEKYNNHFKGSGQMINQETALILKDKYSFINREQDLQLEGLKKAKRSYDPIQNLRAFSLVPLSNQTMSL